MYITNFAKAQVTIFTHFYLISLANTKLTKKNNTIFSNHWRVRDINERMTLVKRQTLVKRHTPSTHELRRSRHRTLRSDTVLPAVEALKADKSDQTEHYLMLKTYHCISVSK